VLLCFLTTSQISQTLRPLVAELKSIKVNANLNPELGFRLTLIKINLYFSKSLVLYLSNAQTVKSNERLPCHLQIASISGTLRNVVVCSKSSE